MSWTTLQNAGILKGRDLSGGTFTTIEVMKAIEKGYKVLEIHKVWHIENTSSDLFSEYVNYFLRLKQEKLGVSGLGSNPRSPGKIHR